MRTAHLNHRTECPCGRTLRGNGWRSHARSCRDWLATNGYPLADGEREGLRADGLTFDQQQQVVRQLGVIRIDAIEKAGFSGHKAAPWDWREVKGFIQGIAKSNGWW
jgi:hypothetical protein